MDSLLGLNFTFYLDEESDSKLMTLQLLGYDVYYLLRFLGVLVIVKREHPKTQQNRKLRKVSWVPLRYQVIHLRNRTHLVSYLNVSN